MTQQREQTLISRVIDGEATDQEWCEFESLADAEPTLWRHMAEAQRDHAALVFGMHGETGTTDALDDPIDLEVPHSNPRLRLTRVSAWSGWAIAALVAIAASVNTGSRLFDDKQFQPQHQAGGLPFSSAADSFFQAYLERGQETGQVVGEMPARVLVDSRPASTGEGYELIYIRQVLERTVVPDLFEVEGQNELGQPTLIRYQQPARSSM